MKTSPTPNTFERLEDDLRALRRKIKKSSDPKAVSVFAALVYCDSIAWIRGYQERFDAAIGYEVCSPRFSFEKNASRMRHALRILRRLNSMLLQQSEGLLSCVGGRDAIAVLYILESVGNDQNRQQVALQLLSAFMEVAKASRRKRRAA